MNNEDAKGSSSSPSPPLPVSTGPDYENYSFSRSSSLSPRVSPPESSRTSAEDLCLMHAYKFRDRRSVSAPSSLSVDRIQPVDDPYPQSTSCLKELLEWFVQRCCCICFSWNLNSPSSIKARQLVLVEKMHQSWVVCTTCESRFQMGDC